MAIKDLNQEDFERTLNQYIRPSAPIDSFEHLVDREKQLASVEEAVNSPGRHIFIFGDRGAGKTSLAQTIAYKHHPSHSSPIFTACGRNVLTQ